MLPAHRFILSSRSSYFRDLFAGSQPAVVELNDIRPNVFALLLSYLYTGQHEAMNESVYVSIASSRDGQSDTPSAPEHEQKACHELLEQELSGFAFSASNLRRDADGNSSSSEDEMSSHVGRHSQRILIPNRQQALKQRASDYRHRRTSSESQTPLSPNSTSVFAVYQTVSQGDDDEEVKPNRRQSHSHRESETMPSIVEELYDASIKFGVSALTRW